MTYPIFWEGPPVPHILVLPERPEGLVAREREDGRIVLANQMGAAVFVRRGTVFEGAAGQRWCLLSDALVPGLATTPVLARRAPASVARNFLWPRDAAIGWTPHLASSLVRLGGRPGRVPEPFSAEDLRHRAAAIATAPGQVGLMTYGRYGLVGFEALRDTLSWRAYAEDVVHEQVDAAFRQTRRPALDVPPEKLLRMINDVLADGGDDEAAGLQMSFFEGAPLRVAYEAEDLHAG